MFRQTFLFKKNNMVSNKEYQTFLDSERIYTCSKCHTHLAEHKELISKAFQGRLGRAYLFNAVENVCLGQKEDRTLITGVHTVKDISCIGCNTVIGWKYVHAFQEDQKYKENKYIVEKAMILKENNW
ncbi:yippee zinc-binding/DNA-binding /Mis18, centromere assembly-domain-containing protein [Gigaspora rosea]|uniref:Protein yippee-like n=1 Tax=Gigaspora rosea TaxID=44941 RepID=A0A397U1J6_9GLOM|nr:yippee zinc-binding/DNA-binding /Mis18, centromere assembly-domain-containing protein [Gigaspora rosea]